MFGRKKDAEATTVLILDIESGSVGAALAQRQGDTLNVLHETRIHLPVRPHRNAATMAEDIERTVSRLAPDLSRQAQGEGGIADISIFMAPPWGTPNLANRKPDFVPHMRDALRRELSPYFVPAPKFYTNAGATLQGLTSLLPYEGKFLLTIVTHEMTELLLVNDGAVVGHASVPHGINLPLRTLKAHGNLSDAEARSALKLGHLTEPLNAATETYAGELLAAGRELIDVEGPLRVWVVSQAGDHFAQAMSHPNLSALFPQGGEVRALLPQHARSVGGSRDIFIILEVLFSLPL